MKLQAHSILAISLALGGWPLAAQTAVDLTRQGRVESGAQVPAQCVAGQLFLQSGGTNGPVLYVCTEANVWSASTSYTAGTGIAISGSAIATEDAMIPVYYTGAGAPTIGCTLGRDYYVDLMAGNLYFCKAANTWQAVSGVGHTHAASDITSGTLSASLMPASTVTTAQANTYSAGKRQSVVHDGSNAGLRLTPAAGDPAGAQDGDIWYNLTTGKFRRRENGLISDWDISGTAHNLLSATHTDTSPATVTRGDLITGQGSTAAWSRLPLGTTGTYLRSNGTDLVYTNLPLGDLPTGYSWSNLANVPANFTPSLHAATHRNGGSDEIATATPGAYGIPKAGAGGTLAAGWLPAPTASTAGGVESIAAAAHQWVSSIDTAGVPHQSQPTCWDLSNAAASCATDATNATNISTGTLPAGRLPNPGASSLGGVQSKDCSATGHVQKINTDGTITCSADAAGSGGSATMAGEYKPLGDFNSSSQTYSATPNTVYYFRFTPHITVPYAHFIGLLGAASSGTHVAMAVMDSTCTKISGSDVNLSGLQTSGNGWVYNGPSSAVTLTAGNEYYWAVVGEAAYSWEQFGVGLNAFYFAGTPDVPYFTGATAATGSGATLAVPGTCGTRSKISDQYRPVLILSTH